MKYLLTSTAFALAMAGGAYAETTIIAFDQVEVQQGDFLASKLIGMRIYNSKTPLDPNAAIADGGEADWDDIGELNDLLITQEGEVSAVILGVGGFLGIDQRDVAVPMSDLTVVHELDDPDSRFLVVSTTKEVLEQMPAFDRENAIIAANLDSGAATHGMLIRPKVEREGYSEANAEAVQQLTAEDLEGANVYGADDQKVGEINALILGDEGKINQVAIGIGGFLGLGERSIAVGFDQLQILKKNDSNEVRIYIDSTKNALKALPEYKG